MEQCTHCGAWGSESVCPYCGCDMPNVKRKTHTETITADAGAYAKSGYSEPKINADASFEPVEKSKTVALLLCIFGGFFGLHLFYVGRIGKGILYLFTVGLFYIGWWVDIVLILLGRFKDKNGNYLT